MWSKILNALSGKKTVGTGLAMIIYNLLILFVPELKENLDPGTVNQVLGALMVIFLRFGVKKVE